MNSTGECGTGSGEKIIRVNEVELCVESFGDLADPPILLVSGPPLGCSMLCWEAEFCVRLAAESRFVVRYDLRDFGRSVTYPPGSPPYGLRDLVADSAGVLDAFGLPSAHVVGFGVGGWISQLLALDHPERVGTLSLIATRPTAQGPNDSDLPEHSDGVMEHVTTAEAPDWSDRAAVIDYIAAFERVLSQTAHFDEAAVRHRAERVFDRSTDIAASMTNPPGVDPGGRWRERLTTLDVPTLVVHGTDDPFFPYGNGRALAEEIPGARFLPLDGVGHELPRSAWDLVIPALTPD